MKIVLFEKKKRVKFKDYEKGKERFELLLTRILLPKRFNSYSLIFIDSKSDNEIVLNLNAERAKEILKQLLAKRGKILLKKQENEIFLERIEDDNFEYKRYSWGWKLEYVKEDIPF